MSRPLSELAVALMLIAAGPAPAQEGIPITLANPAPAHLSGVSLVEIGLRFQGSVPSPLDVIPLIRTPEHPDWTLIVIPPVRIAGGGAILRGPAGAETLVVIRGRGQPGYVVAGPFRWTGGATIDVPARRRRTVRVSKPDLGAAPVAWLAREDMGSPSGLPWCGCVPGGDCECFGVPYDAPGMVVSTSPGKVLFAAAPGPASLSGVEIVSASSAAWGRLLLIDRSDHAPARADMVRVSARKFQVPRLRPTPTRVETEPDACVRVEKVAEDVHWVSGQHTDGQTWVEVTASGRAPARLAVSELVSASAAVPLHVSLEEGGVVAGRVKDAAGAAAPGSIVTLYRLVADERTDRKRPPRRVTVAETTTDDEGGFRFGDVAREPHEVMAMHRERGRAEQVVDPDSTEVELLLRRPPRATGRVVRDGIGAAGVRVSTVPDLAEFAASEDVTELAGGETETDRDGWFAVSMAPRGRVELRIGGDATGVRRLSLGAVERLPPVVDVGIVDLSPLPPLTLVLEESSGCELALAGPIGLAGVTVHRAVRLGASVYQARLPEAGTWLINATCPGGRPRELSPAIVEVVEGGGERTIQLLWRE